MDLAQITHSLEKIRRHAERQRTAEASSEGGESRHHAYFWALLEEHAATLRRHAVELNVAQLGGEDAVGFTPDILEAAHVEVVRIEQEKIEREEEARRIPEHADGLHPSHDGLHASHVGIAGELAPSAEALLAFAWGVNDRAPLPREDRPGAAVHVDVDPVALHDELARRSVYGEPGPIGFPKLLDTLRAQGPVGSAAAFREADAFYAAGFPQLAAQLDAVGRELLEAAGVVETTGEVVDEGEHFDDGEQLDESDDDGEGSDVEVEPDASLVSDVQGASTPRAKKKKRKRGRG